MSIKHRLQALERATAPRRPVPSAWASIEAARAAGVPTGAGFIIVGPPMPIDEWVKAAAAQQAALTREHCDEAEH